LIEEQVSLKKFSTFQVGGTARYFFKATTIEDFEFALNWAHTKAIPWMVIGRGSNTLFSDAGFDGLIILSSLQYMHQEETIFTVGSGFSFSYLGIKTAKLGFSGLEFASGIPGSVGGAIYMNAGAQGGETFDTLKQVKFLDEGGRLITLKKEAISHSYRKTLFHEKKGIIIEGTFELQKKEDARLKQQELLEYRLATQPYDQPSLGCFFKNPNGGVGAGQLIDQCGLKGLAIGGAQVSTLHANFIVNLNQATTQDVITLMDLVKKKVFEQTGINLQDEIKLINKDGI